MKKPKWQAYGESWNPELHANPENAAHEVMMDLKVEMLAAIVALEAERDALRAEVERVKGEYEYVITREPAAKYEAALRGILEHEPHEVVKDKFAYDRMVGAYRDAARAALADGATIKGV